MTSSGALELGRSAAAERRWADAYDRLSDRSALYAMGAAFYGTEAPAASPKAGDAE